MRSIVLGGDLTDAKDYHPASLTNRIVSSILSLTEVVDNIYILMGNHDYLKQGHAYFAFLSRFPKVHFITKPFEDSAVSSDGPIALFLPHTKTPAEDWKGYNFDDIGYVFMHQTFSGAKSESGQVMENALRAPTFPKTVKAFSGDIHVPQILGDVEYIGSPYHVHFGDKFDPRCILIDRRNRLVDLRFDTIRRLTLTAGSLRELKHLEVRKGDQVKLRMKISEAEKHEWHRIRREAAAWLHEQGADTHAIELILDKTRRARIGVVDTPQARRVLTDDEAVEQFVRGNDLGPDALDLGLELLR